MPITKSTIEAELLRHGYHAFITHGNSMAPMLRDKKDIVVVSQINSVLRKYELPLYRRPNGEYVLHRVIGITESGYITCGDNRYKVEVVPFDWVIGKVIGYYRGKRFVTDKSLLYKVYVHLWCDFFFLRKIYLQIKFKAWDVISCSDKSSSIL